ncbi:MAG: 50S ribosomal protein L28 [Candidatus Omnitrophica bacterium]|nr:50S ribosomal protein L28 [Candidatus Omnitrophota bacterium]MBI2174765.1 50S ribosomal protein L28 [Candidatus Omnitrophota bacterium]
MKECAICGKAPVVGHTVTHRGKLKKQGGVGRRTVRVNRRRFLPNLQRATILLNGTIRHARVCTQCLRSGRVVKAPSRRALQLPKEAAHSS